MSTLTVRQLAEIADYELGAVPGTPIEVREVVNQAGEHIVAAHRWKWLEGRSATLRPRPQIELTGATWAQATLRLTKIGAFTDYSFLSGDTIDILDGTGATIGVYQVAAKFSSDALTLVSSIGAAADAQTDIEALMPNDQVALPSDFDPQEIVAYSLSNGLIGQMDMISPQTMLDLRSWPALGTTVGFWALLRHVIGPSGGQPVPRLELWPKTDSDEQALVIFFRAGWREPALDTEALAIPHWLNSLFVEVFKCFLMGHEEPEGGTVDQRLSALRQGVTWRDAMVRDGVMQNDHGPRENNWMDDGGRYISRYAVPPKMIAP